MTQTLFVYTRRDTFINEIPTFEIFDRIPSPLREERKLSVLHGFGCTSTRTEVQQQYSADCSETYPCTLLVKLVHEQKLPGANNLNIDDGNYICEFTYIREISLIRSTGN